MLSVINGHAGPHVAGTSLRLWAVESGSNMYSLTQKPSGSSSSLSSLSESLQSAGFGDGGGESPPEQTEGSPRDCFPCLCC